MHTDTRISKQHPNYLDFMYNLLSEVSESYNEQFYKRENKGSYLRPVTFKNRFANPTPPNFICQSTESSEGTQEIIHPNTKDVLKFPNDNIYGSISLFQPSLLHKKTLLYSEEELIRLKGPSRLIGFLVTIAMNEKASSALRWTGNGLEFVLVNRDLVAKMWGNRKHNTKDMDYLKLSRAIREKYEKKDNNGRIIKEGKLSKGTRTYSYVFTKNAHSELCRNANKSINEILEYAEKIGRKYKETVDSNPQDFIDINF